MKKSNILAHRGLWNCSSERNTRSAIFKALKKGFGIETDVRYDRKIGLVVSHDILKNEDNILPFEELLIEYKKYNLNSKIAINIKSDGLHYELSNILNKYNIDQYFLFDMSIPDLISGIKYNLNQFIRFSNYEDPLPYSKFTNGVWIDNFNSNLPSKKEIYNICKIWKSVVFVSPELHQRNHLNYWSYIKSFYKESQIETMICTDYPLDANTFFNL